MAKKRREKKAREGGKEIVGRNVAQVPHWWNRDRSSCRHLWYPITGLRRNAPRIVHLLASVLENGASHFLRTVHLVAVSLFSWFSNVQASPFVQFVPDGPLSIFVRLVNAGQGHGTIDAVTNFARVFLGSTTLLPMLLSLVPASHTTPFQEFYREIDPTFDYTASVTASTLKSSIRDSYTQLPRPAGSGTSLHLADRKMF